MKPPEKDREYWLSKAADARAAADRPTDPVPRQHMIAVAAGYERLAELVTEKPEATADK